MAHKHGMSRVIDKFVNPSRLENEGALRKAVAGKVVLVTGASFGLGEATARELAAAGATVLVVARTAEKLEAVVSGIKAEGGSAYAYAADLTDFDSIEPLVQAMLADHGGIDIVVNNAGKSMRRSLDLQYDRFHDFTRMTNINYLGPIRLLLAVVPHMRERGSGLIVNVSTVGVLGIPPGPRWGVYQSTKGAFDTWLRSVAPELASEGVDVSTIYMTLIHTRMSAPTPSMQKMRGGMDAEDAAGLITRAIVKREREIVPWWAVPAEAAETLVRGPLYQYMRFLYAKGQDSASALGEAPLPQEHPRARSAAKKHVS